MGRGDTRAVPNDGGVHRSPLGLRPSEPELLAAAMGPPLSANSTVNPLAPLLSLSLAPLLSLSLSLSLSLCLSPLAAPFSLALLSAFCSQSLVLTTSLPMPAGRQCMTHMQREPAGRAVSRPYRRPTVECVESVEQRGAQPVLHRLLCPVERVSVVGSDVVPATAR